MFFFHLEEGCGQPSNQCSVSSQLVEQSNAVFVCFVFTSKISETPHFWSCVLSLDFCSLYWVHPVNQCLSITSPVTLDRHVRGSFI